MNDYVRAHERHEKDFVISFLKDGEVHAYVGGDISLGGFSFITNEFIDSLTIGTELTVKVTNTLIGSSYRIEKAIIRNFMTANHGCQVGCQILHLNSSAKGMHELFCVAEDIRNVEFKGDISAHFINKAKDAVIALNLSVGQIESSLHGTHHSSEQVSQAVVEMHSLVSHWQKTIEDEQLTDREKVEVFEQQLPLYFEHKSKSTIAVQFFDRLSQRLTGVSKCLLSMAYMFADHEKFVSENDWNALMSDFRRAYVSQGDIEAFEQLISGMSLQEAMVLLIKSQSQQEADMDEDDIELF